MSGGRFVRNIVVDTGPLVALFVRSDRDHARVRAFLRDTPCVLVTTWPVATEACHLLPEAGRLKFMRWVVSGGVAAFELAPQDPPAMLALLEKYRDRPMDLADASLVVVAERLGITEVLTVDRSDFDVYRLSANRRFVQVLST
jgi:predicted nucleic acid-binding protein